jgi:hypothetical protein
LEEVVSPLAPSRPLSNPFASSDAEPGEGMHTHEVLSANGTRNRAFDGFELCPGCIEVYGIDHTRMMGLKAIRHNGMNGMAGKLRRFGVMDHTYREMIWSATGWRDISELAQNVSKNGKLISMMSRVHGRCELLHLQCQH